MKIRLKKKYAIILLVLAGISLFALVVGESYAFFTHQVTSKDYVVYTGNLQIDYTKTGSLINLTNTYPKTNTDGLQEAGYSFNITNNGNIDARYQIRLELDTNNTIPIEYIKLAYVKEKENNVTTNNSYIEPVLLSNLNNTLTFVTNQQLEASKMDSYTLKMWIDYNAPNDIQGKTFKATIVIDSLQDVEDGYVMSGTRPIITLNKTTTGETDMHLLQNTDPNAAFTDPGVLSVKDDKDLLTQADVRISYQYTSDGENLSTVNGIDLATTGVYYINYEVTDSDNLTGTAVRVVTVNNTPAIPTITLRGNAAITLSEKQEYYEYGVNKLAKTKLLTIGEVKTTTPGIYTIRYIAIDNNGQINSVTRTVTINKVTLQGLAKMVYDSQEQLYSYPEISSTSYDAGDSDGMYSMDVSNGFSNGVSGTTYYFRGDVTNNYVDFAGLTWRIIRINEDGTVRMITNSNIDNGTYYRFADDESNMLNAYYSVGGAITYMNNWYNSNIGNNQAYSSKVASGNYFCEAMKAISVDAFDSGPGTTPSDNYLPNLTCSNDNNGKGLVSGSAGLITYDEAVLAGLHPSGNNQNCYINGYFWTMSPAGFTSSGASVWIIEADEIMANSVKYDDYGIRAVINLKSDTTATIDPTTGHYVIN